MGTYPNAYAHIHTMFFWPYATKLSVELYRSPRFHKDNKKHQPRVRAWEESWAQALVSLLSPWHTSQNSAHNRCSKSGERRIQATKMNYGSSSCHSLSLYLSLTLCQALCMYFLISPSSSQELGDRTSAPRSQALRPRSHISGPTGLSDLSIGVILFLLNF